MKIAISSKDKNLESEIDPRFGRCSYFIIVEVENKEIRNFEAIENIATAEQGSAGISAAQLVADKANDL